MERLIMHVDMDAFFAAVEQRDNPELVGKPVIVGALPGGRGVASTCSYEARVFGIRSGMPISEAYRRCPHGIFVRPDFKRYLEASQGLMNILEEISPVVEPVSIDEAYVDISGLRRLIGTPEVIGEKTKSRIVERLNLTASIGIGPNRAVAKIASDRVKPDGLTIVTADWVMEFLAPLPVGELRGVGKVTREALEKRRLFRIRDLQEADLEDLRRWFGRVGGTWLYRQARGETSDRVGEAPERKQISKETTFAEDVTDEEELRNVMLGLACGICRSARRKGVAGQVVTIKVRLPGFETHTVQRKMRHATNFDLTVFEEAWNLYATSPYTGKPVRLIGVGISSLGSESTARSDLFSAADTSRKSKLYKALDQVTSRHGRNAIRFASARGRGRDEDE